MQSRRDFLQFMGQLSAGAVGASLLEGCVLFGPKPSKSSATKTAAARHPKGDSLAMSQGLSERVLLAYDDVIGAQGERFGFNNDFVAFQNLPGKTDEALLFINHEFPHELFISGFQKGVKTKAQVEMEQRALGASVVKIHFKEGHWQPVLGDKLNRRFSAKTPIPFANNIRIAGADTAIGTFANCAGGQTPWGTFLTCEENYEDMYGEVVFKGGKRFVTLNGAKYQWERYFHYPPEHYGWVVEVDPIAGTARKLPQLGRFAHEAAKVVLTPSGHCVVYTGDDANGGFFYKFVGDKPHSLDSGTLYVAKVDEGRWVPLSLTESPELQKISNKPLDILIRTREAAALLGATPLHRPEGIAVDAKNAVYLAQTNDFSRSDKFGQICKFREENDDPRSLKFTYSTFLMGGPQWGFACPDNIAFDPRGNLWFTTDMSEEKIGKDYTFGNNALFMVPMTGTQAGRPLLMAQAPNDAELTGPCFSPDGRTLFLSVQHPGSKTTDLKKPTSSWHVRNDGIPRPAVVAITGPFLNQHSAAL